ncbi:hypothetical protein HY030_00820 [Candidatus Gottesmanbacteria bacterium]|nr:hypothetical protein [Candidatus Gottesmanbacteria bacterium]
MLKTYLYVPEELNREIEQLVKIQNASKAEVIRLVLKAGVAQIKSQKTGGAEVLLKLAEIGKKAGAKGPKDLSRNIDKYLWKTYE